jgi:NADP-dependent 3-hydroxy acid dehydrogenase YdfG
LDLSSPGERRGAPSLDVTGEPLRDRVAVVTGASSGIGAAVARALAREGVHLALAARRQDALLEVRSTLVPEGGARSLVVPTDVTDRGQVGALVSRAEVELGAVDFLVNCAGVMYFTLMRNVREEEWDRTVEVNCKGALNCVAAVLPRMLGRGRGHVVTISSDAGRKVFPGLAVYSASKFFVEALSQGLRLETAGTGLRVTTIQPGNVATDLLALSGDEEALYLYGRPSGARVLDADDVAAAVIYALTQPEHVAVNEVLVEPRDEPV